MDKAESLKKGAVTTALAGGSVLVITPGVLAQAAPDPVTEVNNLVTNLGTITGGVITVMIAAIGVRLAIKQLNRLMTKG